MLNKGLLIDEIRKKKSMSLDAFVNCTGLSEKDAKGILSGKVNPYTKTFLRYVLALKARGEDVVRAAKALNTPDIEIRELAYAIDSCDVSLGCVNAYETIVNHVPLPLRDVIIAADLARFITKKEDGIRLKITDRELDILRRIIEARSEYVVYAGGDNAQN